MGFITRSYEHPDGGSLLQLYKALARAHLEYGHVIWLLCFKKDLSKVENVPTGGAITNKHSATAITGSTGRA